MAVVLFADWQSVQMSFVCLPCIESSGLTTGEPLMMAAQNLHMV
jgi:hypothetical protein